MTIDSGGNEQVTATNRAYYDEADRKVDEYITALLACLRKSPAPAPHDMPADSDRMRYGAIERAMMAAHHQLYREHQRWKESRS